jgi:hypothetical protein
VPDIQEGRKRLAAAGLLLVGVGFAGGFGLARRSTSPLKPPLTAPSSAERPAHSVEIRIEPSAVRLTDTTLELRELPPPPKQDLTAHDEKP